MTEIESPNFLGAAAYCDFVVWLHVTVRYIDI